MSVVITIGVVLSLAAGAGELVRAVIARMLAPAAPRRRRDGAATASPPRDDDLAA